MQGKSWQPTIRQAVIASKAISFAGGSSPWLGMKGTVTKLLTARACMVQLEDRSAPMMFFTRELEPLDDNSTT